METPKTPSNAGSGTLSRRGFAKTAGAAAAAFGFQVVPSRVFGANQRPALAGIGSGGKGRVDIAESAKSGFDVVSLVDVLDVTKMPEVQGRIKSLAETREKYPDAEFYLDYREMIADMKDKVDAVTISTPDHHHFHAAVAAMKAGMHVYVQKPLTHGIWEARKLLELSEETGVATQMGNQAHANGSMRRAVELIRAGIIGKVREVHAWTNRPIWPQGFLTPPDPEPVPDYLDWEQWIGPAQHVEYSPKIAPFAWRGWWEYGTGALGDMACHIMDMPYWALKLNAPTSVKAEERGATEFSPPISSHIAWEFPANDLTDGNGLTFHWWDGYPDASFVRDGWRLEKGSNDYNRPPDDVMEGVNYKQYGSVLIGEKGKFFFNRGNDKWVIKPTSGVDGFPWPDETVPRARGNNNYHEWIDAINGDIPYGQSYFGNAVPLTETVLLGVLAQRVPNTKLEWDAEKLEVEGKPELKPYIQREYRKGWEIEV